jgi:hypothetical protein
MRSAIGISVHTGWAAWVVAAGSPAAPVIAANEVIDLLGDEDRFVYHAAALLQTGAARSVANARKKALAAAKAAFARLATKDVVACAIVAKAGDLGELDWILAAHPRIHTAEGRFYRDVLREASTVPVSLVPPSEIAGRVDRVGKLAAPPWGKDQKLAALAAWTVLGASI